MKKFLIVMLMGIIFGGGQISFAQKLSVAPPPNRDAIQQSEEAQRRFKESMKNKSSRDKQMPAPNSAKKN